MRPDRAALFDLDGTLIDSAPSILGTLAAVLEQHGLVPLVRLERSLIGPPLADMLKRVTHCEDPAVLASLRADFATAYDTQGFQASLVFDGIEDLLVDLRQLNIRLFVVTNKRIEPTRRIIDHLGWSRHFEGVYAADAFRPALAGKHRVLEAVVRAHRLDAAGCVYVGDRTEDQAAACAVGMPFLGVSWGYGEWTPACGASAIPLVLDQAAALRRAITLQLNG